MMLTLLREFFIIIFLYETQFTRFQLLFSFCFKINSSNNNGKYTIKNEITLKSIINNRNWICEFRLILHNSTYVYLLYTVPFSRLEFQQVYSKNADATHKHARNYSQSNRNACTCTSVMGTGGGGG